MSKLGVGASGMVLVVGVVAGDCVNGSWDELWVGSVAIVVKFKIDRVMVGLLRRVVWVVGVGDCERRQWKGEREKECLVVFYE